MERAPNGRARDARAFTIVFLFGALLSFGAVALSFAFDTPLGPLLNPTPAAIIAGFLGAGPPLALLFWLMRTTWAPVVRFRESQIDFLREIGFSFTPLRITLLSLAAGVGEELLFRGVLQTFADRHLPLIAAIALTNLLFGALHARTLLYALAAAIVGAYLGWLFVVTKSLMSAIIAHTVYDFIALEKARRILSERAAKDG